MEKLQKFEEKNVGIKSVAVTPRRVNYKTGQAFLGLVKLKT